MKLYSAAATALLLTSSLLIVLTDGEQDCRKNGHTMDTMAYKIDAGILMTEEVTSSSDEDVAVEMDSAKPVVIASLPSDGTTDTGISVTSTVYEEEDGRDNLKYMPVFDRAWYKRTMGIMVGCAHCSDSTSGERQSGGTRHPKKDRRRRVKETTCYGKCLDSSGSESFAFDPPDYVDKASLSAAAPLTLSAAEGKQVTMGRLAGETDFGVADIVAMSTGSATIDTVQYSLGHCPDAQAEIGAEIAAIEQRVAAGMDAAIADEPCLIEAGARAYVEATPADATDTRRE